MLIITFAGERHEVQESATFVVGRDGDLRVGDNPYLHRRFLEFRYQGDLWWLANLGKQITATVSDRASGVHAWLTPAGRMPLVFPSMVLRFSAGPSSYEIELELPNAIYEPATPELIDDGFATIQPVQLTPDQKLMLVALSEPALRRDAPGIADIPSSSLAAQRLGWTTKKFEKKLENVCERLARQGLTRLRGEVGDPASSRRARLVEYALATRLVVPGDLRLLDAPTPLGGTTDEE